MYGVGYDCAWCLGNANNKHWWVVSASYTCISFGFRLDTIYGVWSGSRIRIWCKLGPLYEGGIKRDLCVHGGRIISWVKILLEYHVSPGMKWVNNIIYCKVMEKRRSLIWVLRTGRMNGPWSPAEMVVNLVVCSGMRILVRKYLRSKYNDGIGDIEWYSWRITMLGYISIPDASTIYVLFSYISFSGKCQYSKKDQEHRKQLLTIIIRLSYKLLSCTTPDAHM